MKTANQRSAVISTLLIALLMLILLNLGILVDCFALFPLFENISVDTTILNWIKSTAIIRYLIMIEIIIINLLKALKLFHKYDVVLLLLFINLRVFFWCKMMIFFHSINSLSIHFDETECWNIGSKGERNNFLLLLWNRVEELSKQFHLKQNWVCIAVVTVWFTSRINHSLAHHKY